ncbi:hypothetical protein M0R45_002653 [Rubus argutus]|uniref:Photosystem I assembly protein Ycf4 n=1 Tax=Rubus argutus TaxID=59490 RepID=A0AAW1VMG7_RUBAR
MDLHSKRKDECPDVAASNPSNDTRLQSINFHWDLLPWPSKSTSRSTWYLWFDVGLLHSGLMIGLIRSNYNTWAIPKYNVQFFIPWHRERYQ